MVELLKSCECSRVNLDQCEYGLKIPNGEGTLGPAKKSTTFAGTMPHMSMLEKKCSGNHEHVAVLGCVKVQGAWEKRSKLAGSYPNKLCKSYVRAFEQSFA